MTRAEAVLVALQGLTSAYVPLGAVGLRRPLADHFKSNVFYGGLTYSSHPVSLAAALAMAGRSRVRLEFAFSNLFNLENLDVPASMNVTSSAFGRITRTQYAKDSFQGSSAYGRAETAVPRTPTAP